MWKFGSLYPIDVRCMQMRRIYFNLSNIWHLFNKINCQIVLLFQPMADFVADGIWMCEIDAYPTLVRAPIQKLNENFLLNKEISDNPYQAANH